MTMEKNDFMLRALQLAQENVDQGGGPFGAVIVRDGRIIAEGSNMVTWDNDPTAHAEVVAIRKAAKVLGDFQLDGCEIYASCEPCPMCLSAIYWARIPVVYYAADRHDAEEAGFDDSRIYEQLQKKIKDRDIKMMQLKPEDSLEAFKKWNEQSDKTTY